MDYTITENIIDYDMMEIIIKENGMTDEQLTQLLENEGWAVGDADVSEIAYQYSREIYWFRDFSLWVKLDELDENEDVIDSLIYLAD